MSADMTLKRVRSLVASLREVGDNRTANLVEATIEPSAKSAEVDPRKVLQFHQEANSVAR